MAGSHYGYAFGEFEISLDGILCFQGERTVLPPKELAVIICLLENAGDVVSKDSLVEFAWQCDAGDESLTRCIYSLRKRFRAHEGKQYIDTVYGRGYRLVPQVKIITQPNGCTDTSECSLAIFPFNSNRDEEINVDMLHSSLINCFSRSEHLTVLPATLTRACRSTTDIGRYLDMLNPDYYLAGYFLSNNDKLLLSIELVKYSSNKLEYNTLIEIESLLHISSVALQVKDIVMTAMGFSNISFA